MAPSHGSNADVFANGYVLSNYLNSASFSGERDASESTVFKVKSKQYVPGLKDSSMSAEGVFDGVLDAVDDVLYAALGIPSSGIVSYFPDGADVIGRRAFTLDTVETSYEINTEIGDVAQISAEFQAGDKGYFSRGVVASVMSLKAAAGNTASVDGTAQSTNGASLTAHVTTSAALVMKLQDSADNTTFADLAGSMTFTTGRGSQRIIVPGTIRRYLRAIWTGSGTFAAVIDRV